MGRRNRCAFGGRGLGGVILKVFKTGGVFRTDWISISVALVL